MQSEVKGLNEHGDCDDDLCNDNELEKRQDFSEAVITWERDDGWNRERHYFCCNAILRINRCRRRRIHYILNVVEHENVSPDCERCPFLWGFGFRRGEGDGCVLTINEVELR